MKPWIGMACLTTAIVLGFSVSTFACSCDATPNPACRAYGVTPFIFTATVLESDPYEPNSQRREQKATLRILTNIKGSDFGEVTIFSNPRCGPFFQPGKTYLVYAFGSAERLETGMCTRTQLLEDSQEDFEYFDKRPSLKKGLIFGSVSKFALSHGDGFADLLKPVANIPIRFQSGERKHVFVVRSNKSGQFVIPNVVPGKYWLEVLLPRRLRISPNTRTQPIDIFDLKEKGCAEIKVYVQFEGEISGKVLDERGKGVAGLDVTLVSADYKFEGPNDTAPLLEWTISRANGSYVLDGIPPGRYRLGIGIGGAFSSFGKNGQVFFPNTTDPNKAQILTVVEGRPLRNMNLPLPKKKS